MRSILHPSLVNGRFGDPALYVETLHQRGAMLFDIGDLSPLSARDLLRVSHVFISHMHMDHFIGFDALLRVCVGRDKSIALVGPEGLCERVHHRLQSYTWDLVDRYDTDLIFDVTELLDAGRARSARFRFKNGFAWEQRDEVGIAGGLIATCNGIEVRAVLLQHHGPCLGFAIAATAHANVWKNKLDERGLATGSWLQALKRAVVEGMADDHPIVLPSGQSVPLAELRDLVTITAGQKIAYITDVADTPANRAAIEALARGASTLYIEGGFAAADAEQARHRAHLTTTAAGEIARATGVCRLEPFHFSPRYAGEEERMLQEVAAAFGRDLLP